MVRYNAKHDRITYSGYSNSLTEFKEIWIKEMNDIQEFIKKCELISRSEK